jgi:hypothetical protein
LSFFGTAEQLAEKVGIDRKNVPQGLKPNVFATAYGTAEAMPFQNRAFFRKL